jgi:hypothetical protein
VVRQNLVTVNMNGIRPRDKASSCFVENNTVVFNRLVAEEESPLGNGIRQIEGAKCTIRNNIVCGNLDDGIVFDPAGGARIVSALTECNRVEDNGFTAFSSPQAGSGGVEVRGTDSSFFNRNFIRQNADNPPDDKIRCVSGSLNTGCNVPTGSCGTMTPATCDLACVPPRPVAPGPLWCGPN